MVRSIEEADKPAKRGKKNENQKEAPVSKPTKAQTPKKQKSDKASTSQAHPKKQKKPARRLILQYSSDSDSEYVPPKPKSAPTSESESESSNDEALGRGDTPPRSPTLEIPVRSHPPSPLPSNFDDDEPVTKRHLKAVNEKLDQLLSSSSSGAYSEAALMAVFSSVVTEYSASLSAATKAIEASTSQCQQASLAVDACTKKCKDATAKAAAKKNAQTVNASVEKLQRSLQSERSNLEAARQAIKAANESLHANVNDRLTQLEAELAVENRIMDELDRRSSQLKMQNYKLCTANAEVNDLKSEREVIRSSATDVHSILLHLLEAHDPIITITIRRHLADKLRPALDILSRIKGVPVTGVQPKQGERR
ncbi:uncharacterized protein LOC128127878 [Lactuca sativa]|uniref:uncharacterized protein LOC128127878 n=1 Tax=Lactuca sativa TaxID=4236 RepID=UPI0022AFFAF2|nr:uncharacterized protein LOC128127878 [Lactuca sativa]